MITYDWTILQLDCVPQAPEGQDYVVTAHWQCVGVDGEYSGSTYGACGFAVTQGPTFTPYPDLTQEQVLGWCWANGVDKDANEASVAQQIEDQIDPPIVSPPLPWSE